MGIREARSPMPIEQKSRSFMRCLSGPIGAHGDLCNAAYQDERKKEVSMNRSSYLLQLKPNGTLEKPRSPSSNRTRVLPRTLPSLLCAGGGFIDHTNPRIHDARVGPVLHVLTRNVFVHNLADVGVPPLIPCTSASVQMR